MTYNFDTHEVENTPQINKPKWKISFQDTRQK